MSKPYDKFDFIHSVLKKCQKYQRKNGPTKFKIVLVEAAETRTWEITKKGKIK